MILLKSYFKSSNHHRAKLHTEFISYRLRLCNIKIWQFYTVFAMETTRKLLAQLVITLIIEISAIKNNSSITMNIYNYFFRQNLYQLSNWTFVLTVCPLFQQGVFYYSLILARNYIVRRSQVINKTTVMIDFKFIFKQLHALKTI